MTDLLDDFTGEMQAHLERGLGPSSGRIFEIIPDGLRLDIMVFPPHGDRKDWVFVTAGMSAREMQGLRPEHIAGYSRAELMITLSDAQAKAATGDTPGDADWAPIKMLKSLARWPHVSGMLILPGNTVDITAFAIKFGMAESYNSVLFLPPPAFDGDLFRVPLSNGQTMNIYAVLPLYPGELQVKLDKGESALYDTLNPTGITERFDPNRPDGSKPKKRIGLW
jgi:hypothetical protein